MTARLCLLLAAACVLALVQQALGDCGNDGWGDAPNHVLQPQFVNRRFETVKANIPPNCRATGLRIRACDYGVAPKITISIFDKLKFLVHRKGSIEKPAVVFIAVHCKRYDSSVNVGRTSPPPLFRTGPSYEIFPEPQFNIGQLDVADPEQPFNVYPEPPFNVQPEPAYEAYPEPIFDGGSSLNGYPEPPFNGGSSLNVYPEPIFNGGSSVNVYPDPIFNGGPSSFNVYPGPSYNREPPYTVGSQQPSNLGATPENRRQNSNQQNRFKRNAINPSDWSNYPSPSYGGKNQGKLVVVPLNQLNQPQPGKLVVSPVAPANNWFLPGFPSADFSPSNPFGQNSLVVSPLNPSDDSNYYPQSIVSQFNPFGGWRQPASPVARPNQQRNSRNPNQLGAAPSKSDSSANQQSNSNNSDAY